MCFVYKYYKYNKLIYIINYNTCIYVCVTNTKKNSKY